MSVIDSHIQTIVETWICPTCNSRSFDVNVHEETSIQYDISENKLNATDVYIEQRMFDGVSCYGCGDYFDPDEVYGLID